jgi:chitinase
VTVSLSAPAPYAISVTVATTPTGSTATAGSDYVATTQTLTFAAGVTSLSFSVVINGDKTVESNESVKLTASSTGALIGTLGTITILNDDGAAPMASPVSAASTTPISSATGATLLARSSTSTSALKPASTGGVTRLSAARVDLLSVVAAVKWVTSQARHWSAKPVWTRIPARLLTRRGGRT